MIPTINGQIFDEAADWFVTLREEPNDAAVQERFLAWLRVSPEHVRAYLGIVMLWSDVPSVDPQATLDANALITLARADGNVIALDAQTTNTVAVPSSAEAERSTIRSVSRRRVAIAACAVLATIGTLLSFHLLRASTYATAIGEQRTLTLPDGSKVELNSRSRIRVRFSEEERVVDLLEGQVLFQVVKDPRRVFLVRSGEAQVRAVGTRFDVYRKQSATIVTVVEGRVAVTPDDRAGDRSAVDVSGSTPSVSTAEAGGEIMLAAGEQVTIAPRVSPRPARANVAAATAWTQGQLIFKSSPLSAVVEEFNRYNRQHLVVEEGVEDFPVTAVFATTSYDALVEFLESQPDLTVRIDGNEIRVAPLATQE